MKSYISIKRKLFRLSPYFLLFFFSLLCLYYLGVNTTVQNFKEDNTNPSESTTSHENEWTQTETSSHRRDGLSQQSNSFPRVVTSEIDDFSNNTIKAAFVQQEDRESFGVNDLPIILNYSSSLSTTSVLLNLSNFEEEIESTLSGNEIANMSENRSLEFFRRVEFEIKYSGLEYSSAILKFPTLSGYLMEGIPLNPKEEYSLFSAFIPLYTNFAEISVSGDSLLTFDEGNLSIRSINQSVYLLPVVEQNMTEYLPIFPELHNVSSSSARKQSLEFTSLFKIQKEGNYQLRYSIVPSGFDGSTYSVAVQELDTGASHPILGTTLSSGTQREVEISLYLEEKDYPLALQIEYTQIGRVSASIQNFTISLEQDEENNTLFGIDVNNPLDGVVGPVTAGLQDSSISEFKRPSNPLLVLFLFDIWWLYLLVRKKNSPFFGE